MGRLRLRHLLRLCLIPLVGLLLHLMGLVLLMRLLIRLRGFD